MSGRMSGRGRGRDGGESTSKGAGGGEKKGEGDVRGQGGLGRAVEPRTIPANVVVTRATLLDSIRRVELLSNFVPIQPMKTQLIHMYRVDFEPEVECTRTRGRLHRRAARELFTKEPIYDYAHESRSGQRLAQDETTQEVADDRAGEPVTYVVKFTHTGTTTSGPEMLRVYNIQMKEFLRDLRFYSPQLGVFVHPQHATPINPELMLVRGYRTAANLHEDNRMLMNLEPAQKVMQCKNVLVMMADVRRRVGGDTNFKEAFRAELTGKVVVSKYNNFVYRVEDVNFDMSPSSTFDSQGEQLTYLRYYEERWNERLVDTRQPLLRVVPNNRRRRDDAARERETYLVPELCNLAGLTETQRNDREVRQALIRKSQMAPGDRVKQARDFLHSFHQNAEIRAKLSAWGYNYERELVSLTAHVVPMTRYTATARHRNGPVDNWPVASADRADIRIQQLAGAPEIRKLAVITTRMDLGNNKDNILRALKSGFDRVGLVVGAPMHVDVSEGNQASHYVRAIRGLPADTELAIVIMSQQNKERYDAIKKVASVERGLITQCVTSRLMLGKNANSAAQKIAIQIAAKMGGEPWLCDVLNKKTIVCGYDTYHDTAQRGRSYGAFVASLNESFSRWWSKADAHERLEEISSQIPANMTEAINHYRKLNKGQVPERVILYRDGVGDGQLEHVWRTETSRINEALKAINKSIRFSMIIVNKRIGARFYMKTTGASAHVNPPPGTVIDHTVTRPLRYDFYLISQHTQQGTVTPTYYNIIHDETGYSPETHQKLAFKLCLLYYNWSGTVRVPAPCQYAHKLALLCGENLHAQPNAIMDDKLHFL